MRTDVEPFAPWPETAPLPPMRAATVELTNEEVSEALALYIGDKRGESFAGYAVTQAQVKAGQLTIRVTYWRTEEEAEEKSA